MTVEVGKISNSIDARTEADLISFFRRSATSSVIRVSGNDTEAVGRNPTNSTNEYLERLWRNNKAEMIFGAGIVFAASAAIGYSLGTYARSFSLPSFLSGTKR